MEKIEWRTEKRRIDELKEFPGNPRKASEKQVKDLDESLKRFNVADPLVINTDGTVIGGNFRLKRLKEMGIKEVDVRVPSRELTRKEMEELNLRLNKNTGEWDFDLLANFGENLLKGVGFESVELDKIYDLGLQDKEDEIPPQPIKTDVKYGDIIELGRHRLMCGDATKKEDVEKLLSGKSVDMVFTDPPYDMDISDIMKAYNNIECGNQIWLLTDKLLFAFIKSVDIKLLNSLIVFHLKSIVPNGLYLYRRHIPAVHILRNRNKKFINQHRGFSTVIEMKYRNTFGDKIIEHEKPVESITPLILSFTQRNQLVLDLFGGSGSTLIACEKLNRICYLMEIEPTHCQIIKDRFEQFTKTKGGEK